MLRRPGLLGVIYLVVGVLIAANHSYFSHLDGIKQLLSAVLAIVLWPLILLGVSLVIR